MSESVLCLAMEGAAERLVRDELCRLAQVIAGVERGEIARRPGPQRARGPQRAPFWLAGVEARFWLAGVESPGLEAAALRPAAPRGGAALARLARSGAARPEAGTGQLPCRNPSGKDSVSAQGCTPTHDLPPSPAISRLPDDGGPVRKARRRTCPVSAQGCIPVHPNPRSPAISRHRDEGGRRFGCPLAPSPPGEGHPAGGIICSLPLSQHRGAPQPTIPRHLPRSPATGTRMGGGMAAPSRRRQPENAIPQGPHLRPAAVSAQGCTPPRYPPPSPAISRLRDEGGGLQLPDYSITQSSMEPPGLSGIYQ
jgi:hypothetical protein